MVKKYTIKELLDIVDDPVKIYKKFANEFSKDDIMYAIDKDLEIKYLIKYLKDKFDTEIIKYAVKKNKSINNIDFLQILIKYFKNKFDKELIKYIINKKGDLEILYDNFCDKFDKELIDYAYNKKANLLDLYKYIKELCDCENPEMEEYIANKVKIFSLKKILNTAKDVASVYEEYAYHFTKDDIKYAIDKGLELQHLYHYLGDKFDKELIKYAIKKDDKDISFLYEYLHEKFDKELIKYAIDKGKRLASLFENTADKFDSELIRYAIDRGIDLEYLYYYVGYENNGFTIADIKYAINKKADLQKLYHYLWRAFDDKLKRLYNEKKNEK